MRFVQILLTLIATGGANHFALASADLAAPIHYHCDYTIVGAPFVSLDFDEYDNFHASPTVKVTSYGSSHNETFSLVTPNANEMLHGWISKESKDNQIEYILYPQPQAGGNSEIINNQMPMMKDVWGTCTPS